MDMMTRTLLTGTAVLVVATLLLAFPAAAQSISVHAAPRFEPAVDDLEELPEDARALYPLVADLVITGQFICAQETEVIVEFETVIHPAWAGMSLEPQDALTVSFTIPMGNNNGYQGTEDGPTAGIAWDPEDAPTNHTHRYVLNLAEPQLGSESVDCQPSISNAPTTTGQAFLNITYPFADDGSDDEVPCDQDPEQQKCQTDTADPNAGGDSPGIGALVTVAAVVGMVLLRRKRA